MGRIRHWKQRYDPDAKFVFLKRMRLGLDPKKPNVVPGDPVPSGDIRLGRGRLKRWWDAGIIGRADWVDPDDAKREKRSEQAEEAQRAADLLPRLIERLKELDDAGEDADPAEVNTLLTDVAGVKKCLDNAKRCGIPFELDPALSGEDDHSDRTCLPKFDLAFDLAAAIDTFEASGYAFTVGIDPGVHVSKDGKELGTHPSIEEALAALEKALAEAIEASREEALAALQAIDSEVEARLGGYFDGFLYGRLGSALYVAATELPIPEGSFATWLKAEARPIPTEVLDSFDLSPEEAADLADLRDLLDGKAPESPQEEPKPEAEGSATEPEEAQEGGAQAEGSAAEPVEAPPIEKIHTESTGGGWYAVTVPGEAEPRKVQGTKNLEELLAELKER